MKKDSDFRKEVIKIIEDKIYIKGLESITSEGRLDVEKLMKRLLKRGIRIIWWNTLCFCYIAISSFYATALYDFAKP